MEESFLTNGKEIPPENKEYIYRKSTIFERFLRKITVTIWLEKFDLKIFKIFGLNGKHPT